MEFWSLMLRRGGLKGVIRAQIRLSHEMSLQRCPPPLEALFMRIYITRLDLTLQRLFLRKVTNIKQQNCGFR